MSLTNKEKKALKTALVDLDLVAKATPICDANPELYKDFEITSAQLLALNATPVVVLAGPTDANKAYVPVAAIWHKPAGTAYAGIAAGEDLVLKYTNASGATLMTVETTGFLDQATAQTRYVFASLAVDVNPVANAAIVANLLTGEITTGTSPLRIRVYYNAIDTVL